MSVVVVCILAGAVFALHNGMERRLIEENRQAGSAELLTVRENLFLLMGSQRVFTALLGQRIEESLARERTPSLAALSTYFDYQRETTPSFLFATIAREGVVVDQYPEVNGHAVGFELSALPQYELHIATLGLDDAVSLDGPIYSDGGACYLVSRYLLTKDGEAWGLLSLHYDFRLFLSQIGIDELSSEYRYSFTFTHPGGEEVYHWGEEIDESKAMTMEASYSFLSWQMSMVAAEPWSRQGVARGALIAALGVLISPLVGLLVYVWVRRYQRMARYSITDSLTGLLNRREFSRELERECIKQRPFAIAIIDIDNFKEINDTWGHLDGDAALIQFVEALKHSVRMSDTLARFGGDEFILLLRDCYSTTVVERLHERLSPFEVKLKGTHVYLQFSMGVAFNPFDGDEADLLLRVADHRLYQAKVEGKGRVCAYSMSGS